MFKHLKVGDRVIRSFAGRKQPWKVTAVSETLVTVGMGWTFDRETGMEEDEMLRWGVKYGRTGSMLVES